MCKKEENSIDHIVLQCASTGILSQLDFFYVWDRSGDPLFNKTNVVKLVWALCWEEVEQSMDGCPFMSILDPTHLLNSVLEGQSQPI